VRRSQQKDWLTDVIESAPSVVFVALWQGHMGLQAAGWTGAALAAAVLIGFRRYRVAYNPILLGINIHLLLMTPVIVALFRAGIPDFARMLVGYSQTGVLVTVFLVGCFLSVRSPRGFLGLSGVPAGKRHAYSAVLLAASAATVVWSLVLAAGAGTLVTVGVPLMALFGLRRLMIARWNDRANDLSGLAAGAALAASPAPDTA
jgi:hypothetical protein